MELNKNQRSAVKTIDKNILVNAGAGTGKTKVLTSRYLEILENGQLKENNEIEGIVAITFTKKATEEMMGRIRTEIKKRAIGSNLWEKYYRDMEKANISTIHSFCSKILRENPVEAGIDPYFTIMEENKSKSILKKSINEALNTYLYEKTHSIDFFKSFGINKIEDIVEDYMYIYNHLRASGSCLKDHKENTLHRLDSFKGEIKLDEIIRLTKILMDGLNKNSKISKLKNTMLWENLEQNRCDESNIFEHLIYIRENMGESKKLVEEQNLLRELIDESLLLKEKKNIKTYKYFFEILEEIDEIYSGEKNKLGLLDYEDLQIKTLKLFEENISILRKYQDKYRYLMIDEYQDVNKLQMKIFYILASKESKLDRNNLFVVGDPKQAIYGFRGGSIDVFFETRNDIEGNGLVINLDINYRSVDNIINFTNEVFPNMMTYYEKIRAHRTGNEKNKVEIIDGENVHISRELLAKKIIKLIEEGYDFRDIALIFRSGTNIESYERELSNYNIPYYNNNSNNFFKKQEVLDIVNGIKAISNPYDDISTIGLLRSPSIGLRDETIYFLMENRLENLQNTILNIDLSKITCDEKDITLLKRGKDIINYFRENKNTLTTIEVIDKFLDLTRASENIMPHRLKDKKQALANIEKFKYFTREYVDRENASLEELIDYIEENREAKEGQAAIEALNKNVVKLLTIHSSKGLEFPVVIIPELNKPLNNNFHRFLFEEKIGLGIKSSGTEVNYEAIKKIKSLRESDEETRVLYVAMTRAGKKLILEFTGKNTGHKKNLIQVFEENKLSHFYDIIENIEVGKIIEASLDEKKSYSNIQVGESKKKEFPQISISQFLKFQECKRKFYLENYLGINEKWDNLNYDIRENKIDQPLDGATKGNVVHEFSQRYDGGSIDELLENILKKYKVEDMERAKKQVSRYVDNYIKFHENQKYSYYLSEKEFYLKIEDSILHGIIDRIYIGKDYVKLVDFKTNKRPDKSHLDQVLFYQYVVKNIMPDKKNEASILYLENNKEIYLDSHDENIEHILNRIKSFLKFIEENNSIDQYPKASNCLYCKNQVFCNSI